MASLFNVIDRLLSPSYIYIYKRPAQTGDGNKGSSSSTATFNLVKNILGAGVLSLPSGVGAFSKNPWVSK